MAKPICSEDACEKPVLSRGLCVTHYHRWNRATKDQRPSVGTCEGCGATLRALKRYCGPDCRPRCSVDECGKPAHTQGWCAAHATRASRYGDPLAPKIRGRNEGACEVDGCDAPMRKVGMCADHYQMLRKFGEIRPYLHRWHSEPFCIVCSEPNGSFRGSRQFCSAACRATARRQGLGPYWHRVDSFELNAQQLAERDGALCQLCGCDVDMNAGVPDQMCPSVDHIIPLSHRGTNDADNLQLAHLRCNRAKGNRSCASLLREVVMP